MSARLLPTPHRWGFRANPYRDGAFRWMVCGNKDESLSFHQVSTPAICLCSSPPDRNPESPMRLLPRGTALTSGRQEMQKAQTDSYRTDHEQTSFLRPDDTGDKVHNCRCRSCWRRPLFLCLVERIDLPPLT